MRKLFLKKVIIKLIFFTETAIGNSMEKLHVHKNVCTKCALKSFTIIQNRANIKYIHKYEIKNKYP